MKNFLAMLALLALFTVPLFSDNMDKDKEKRYKDIKKMLDATQAVKMFDQMKNSMKASVGKMVQESLKDKDLEMTDEVKKLYDDFMSKTLDMSMGMIKIEDIINDMIPYYDKYLSNEDIKAIIAFYETPAGKKYLDAAPKIMMDYMPAMMEKMGSSMKNIQAETQKMAKEFAEKIMAIKEKQKKEREAKDK